MIPRPQADEHIPYYDRYIERVPEGSDVFALLSRQPDELRALLHGLTDSQANARPAPGEWSVKEIIGHLCDFELILAYRALCIARDDTTPLASFEPEDYVRAADFNTRSLTDLLDEFAAHRRATVLCFKPLTDTETARRGIAGGSAISTRTLLYSLAGHVMQHIESLKVDYKVGA